MSKKNARGNDLSSPRSKQESKLGNDNARVSASVLPSPETSARSIPGRQSLGPVTPVGNVTSVQQGPKNSSSGFIIQPPSITVMAASTVHVSPVALGPKPVKMKCPACSHQITTKTNKTCSPTAHIIFAVLCILLIWLFAWIPYVVPAFKITHHECPKCQTFLGTYKP